MLLEIYSVHDSKAEAFLPPFSTQNHAVALRMIDDALLDPNHGFSRHAADYTLFHLGAFDQNTGTYNLLAAPVNICSLVTRANSTPFTALSDEADLMTEAGKVTEQLRGMNS